MKLFRLLLIFFVLVLSISTGCDKEEDQPDFDGNWTASTTESSSDISSATLSFTVSGNSVDDINYRIYHDIGLFFGQGWSATLSSDNSFSISPSIGNTSATYNIKLTSSSSGSGSFSFDGDNLDMSASK